MKRVLSGTVIAAAERVVLGRGFSCGANVTIMDTDWHNADRPRGSPETAKHAPVHIEDAVWLGLGVVVLKRVTIGRGSVLAGGGIVPNRCLPACLRQASPRRSCARCALRPTRGRHDVIAGMSPPARDVHGMKGGLSV